MKILVLLQFLVTCLFTDLLGENAGGQGAALGFQYFGGPVVTVLASKTSSKFFINFIHRWKTDFVKPVNRLKLSL
jgi:hypothetical protein